MPRDLAASRRFRKGPLASPAPVEVRGNGTPDRPPTTIGEVRDRVVADVRHEAGNYFHKLYYWADFLNESRGGRAADVTATQMLEDTIRGLEDLLRVTLEYVRPITVNSVHLGAHEMTDGVVRHLVSTLGERVVAKPGAPALEGWAVTVDLGRFSQLLTVMGRRLESGLAVDARVEVAFEVTTGVEGCRLGVSLSGAGAPPTPRPTVADVEWAMAENLARALGGMLGVEAAHGTLTLTLALPLHPHG